MRIRPSDRAIGTVPVCGKRCWHVPITPGMMTNTDGFRVSISSFPASGSPFLVTGCGLMIPASDNLHKLFPAFAIKIGRRKTFVLVNVLITFQTASHRFEHFVVCVGHRSYFIPPHRGLSL
ncbi:hypothetical protein M0R45_014278 [Rubus argutus]|uniref:Uncharacterized protein n=1 Tax=Rubus argutus TaxID=59490 RepID=A0AAW1XMK3_RUBAR